MVWLVYTLCWVCAGILGFILINLACRVAIYTYPDNIELLNTSAPILRFQNSQITVAACGGVFTLLAGIVALALNLYILLLRKGAP